MDKILFKNGTVYDPIRHKMEKRDLALADGFIADTAGFTPDLVVGAEDCIITPGLIDFHVHCYTGGSDGTNEVDGFCLPNGVTTCVDGGTAGTANYAGIIRNVVSRRMTSFIPKLVKQPTAGGGVLDQHHAGSFAVRPVCCNIRYFSRVILRLSA